MKFQPQLIVDAKVNVELDAAVGDALTRLAGFSHEDILDLLGKHLTQDFAKGGKHRKALLRFLKEIQGPALDVKREYYAAVEAIANERKKRK